MSTLGFWIGVGWLICGYAAGGIHGALQDQKRQRGDPAIGMIYFALGYLGLVAALGEWNSTRPSTRRRR